MVQIRPPWVVHFAPEQLVHIAPALLVHFSPESLVHFGADYSQGFPLCMCSLESRDESYKKTSFRTAFNNGRVISHWKRSPVLVSFMRFFLKRIASFCLVFSEAINHCPSVADLTKFSFPQCKPKSRLQKYRLTEKGLKLLERR